MRPAIAQPVTAPRVSDSAALIVLPIRLVVGWTFFSAFWRRVALATFLSVVILGRFTTETHAMAPSSGPTRRWSHHIRGRTRRWLRSDRWPREALMGASGNDMSSLKPNSGGDEDG
jgi:hypothetical protein